MRVWLECSCMFELRNSECSQPNIGLGVLVKRCQCYGPDPAPLDVGTAVSLITACTVR